MMAVDDTEDIHVQCILVLCSSRYFALSREYMFEELFSILVLYLWSPRKPSVPVASVREHYHSHGVARIDRSIDKGVANIHHMTEGASSAKSWTSNRRSSYRWLDPPRAGTRRSPRLIGGNTYWTLVSAIELISNSIPTSANIVRQQQDLPGSWA